MRTMEGVSTRPESSLFHKGFRSGTIQLGTCFHFGNQRIRRWSLNFY